MYLPNTTTEILVFKQYIADQNSNTTFIWPRLYYKLLVNTHTDQTFDVLHSLEWSQFLATVMAAAVAAASGSGGGGRRAKGWW